MMGSNATSPWRCSTFDEYQVGQVLSLNVLSSDDLPSDAVAYVRVRQLHTRTLSCTMTVDILSEESTSALCGVASLKLLDRRFADLQRSSECIEPWSKSKEQAYIKPVDSEEFYTFLHKLRTVENFQRDTEEMWDDGENEAFLAYELLGMWEAETAVYRALRQHQGHLIPRLLAAVDLDVAPPNANRLNEGRDEFSPFHVKGMLLEHLSGCNLFEIVNCFPRSSWQAIVDQAIAIVRVLDDDGIMNSDGTPMNFMVSKPGDTSDERQFQMYMIDFGLCRFRAPDETLAEWNREKSNLDEEGAVGLRMKKALEKQRLAAPGRVASRQEI